MHLSICFTMCTRLYTVYTFDHEHVHDLSALADSARRDESIGTTFVSVAARLGL